MRSCVSFTNPISLYLGESHSAKREFPNFPPLLLYAISLGRRLQNPLQEFAGLASNIMEDLTALRLHPLQDHVKINAGSDEGSTYRLVANSCPSIMTRGVSAYAPD